MFRKSAATLISIRPLVFLSSFILKKRVAPTSIDIQNAKRYAVATIQHRLTASGKSAFPSNFVEWKNAPIATYPCPSPLTCVDGQQVFTKEGCIKSCCFPYNSRGEFLKPNDIEAALQPYCYEIYKTWNADKPEPDTLYHEWNNETGTCEVVDPFLKRWALFPQTRRNEPTPGVTDAPSFLYVESSQQIVITQSYCEE